MKKHFIFIVIAVLQLCSSLYASDMDTLWTRDFWRELNASYPHNFEFHPTNDSIFIFTSYGKDSNGVDTDEMTAHFVNTITGQVFQKYAPIQEAHYTPDGNFLIGHNDSTIAYISLDSMKPVRSYPIVKDGAIDFTVDEKGKFAYSSFILTTDTGRIFGFYRWDIVNGTLQRVDFPDSLLDADSPNCPIERLGIENIEVSDTAKILLMEIFVDRPYPKCNPESRIWGIDLNADTVKYDFKKIHPTYTMSGLNTILPKRTKFIGQGLKYENYEKSGYYSVFDVATGAKIKDMLKGDYYEYTFSKDENFLLTADIIIDPTIEMHVFNFDNYDTVFIYDDSYTGPITISPNNKFLLQLGDILFILYPTNWYSDTITKPREEESNDFLISPNPAQDYIELSLPPCPPGEGWGEGIRIYNILGESVSGLDTPPDPLFLEGGKYRVDVSGLVPGIYFVRVEDFVGRFVKY